MLFRSQLGERLRLRLQRVRERLERQTLALAEAHPRRLLERQRDWLAQRQRLLQALSPSHWLERGFSLVRDRQGRLLRQAEAVAEGDTITVQLLQGELTAQVLSRRLEAPGDA